MSTGSSLHRIATLTARIAKAETDRQGAVAEASGDGAQVWQEPPLPL